METVTVTNPTLKTLENPEKVPQVKKFLGLSKSGWVKLAVFGGLLAVVLVAILQFKVHEQLDDLLEWIDENKLPGFFIFTVAYTLATVLFIPGLILSLGAGFVFGLGLGTLAVWLGATAGMLLSFLLGRYLFRDWIADKTKSFRVWQAIEAAAEADGWKIVGLIRLAPVIPFNALNYALGLTNVNFLHYSIASSLGILPGTLLYVYFGSLADNITAIANGESGVDGTTFLITAVVSGLVVVLVVVLTTYYAKKAIKKKLDAQTGDNGSETASSETNDSSSDDACRMEEGRHPMAALEAVRE